MLKLLLNSNQPSARMMQCKCVLLTTTICHRPSKSKINVCSNIITIIKGKCYVFNVLFVLR